MAYTVNALEASLRAWEDLYFLDELAGMVATAIGKPLDGLPGTASHWAEFRSYLLNFKDGDFDINRFCDRNDDIQFASSLFDSMYPINVAAWTIGSRRVFGLTKELQEKFLAAEYKKVRWSDLLWPFKSFAIALEEPLVEQSVHSRKGSVESRFLLVTSCYEITGDDVGLDEGFECRMFWNDPGEGENLNVILSERERAELREDVRRKNWARIGRKVVQYRRRLGQMRMLPGSVLGWRAQLNEPLFNRAPDNLATATMKLVAGLCLYMESLPSSARSDNDWRTYVPSSSRGVRGVITDERQVCEVVDFHVRSPDTLAVFPRVPKPAGYTVKPHWRVAYKRRRRGEGHIPDAPRVVEVPSTFVHKDQMPPDAIVGGAVTKVR